VEAEQKRSSAREKTIMTKDAPGGREPSPVGTARGLLSFPALLRGEDETSRQQPRGPAPHPEWLDDRRDDQDSTAQREENVLSHIVPTGRG